MERSGYETASPILICADATGPSGLCHIQRGLGASWRSSCGKENFVSLSNADPQPAQWDYSELHQLFNWCKSKKSYVRLQDLGGRIVCSIVLFL